MRLFAGTRTERCVSGTRRESVCIPCTSCAPPEFSTRTRTPTTTWIKAQKESGRCSGRSAAALGGSTLQKTAWLKYYYHLLLHGWVWPGLGIIPKFLIQYQFWYLTQWYCFDTRCFHIDITAQNVSLLIRILSKPRLLYCLPLHKCLNFALVNVPSQWSGAVALTFTLAQAKLCKCL